MPHAKSRPALIALLISAVFIWLSQGAYADSEQQPTDDKRAIKIGFLVPLSGAAAIAGKQMVDGATLYLDEINHRMAGRSVRLVVENDETNPATGMAKMRKLALEDKVSVVAGLDLSNIALKVSPLAEEFQVPLIIAVAAADDLTQLKHNPWVMRTGWCSSMNMPFGQYVFGKLHYKTVVAVGMDYPYGWEMAGDFQKAFERAGGKIVQRIWLPLGFVDFSGLLKKIRRDADAVYLCTVEPAASIVPRQYAELGLKMPLIGAGTSFDDAWLPQIGNYVNGAVSTLPYSITLDTASNRRFRQAFKAKYEGEPTQQALQSYVCMMFIKAAVDSLKGDIADRSKWLAALKKVQLKDSPKGPMRLDAFGNVVENIYVRKVEKVHGKLQNAVIDTFPMVSQFGQDDPETFMKDPVPSRDYPPCRYCLP